MLESTYCILISLFVLMFLVSYGFFLYQKTLVKVVANEVAEEVSQTYKLRYVKDSESVKPTEVSGVGLYRYLFHVDNFDEKNEIKIRKLANSHLTKTSLAKEDGSLDVNIDTVVDDIGRRHYVVTVKQRYEFLLGDLLSLIGQEDVQQLEATVYVESMDVLNYVNTVKTTKYGISKLSQDSSIIGLVDSAISLLKSIFDN